MAARHFDYVIVGAGSAGCVLANRLTEDAGVSVLLLESGGMDASLFIHMPSALAYPMANPKYSWQYHSEPEPGMDMRRIHCPRGRVIGGSSSINGMVYVRGHALDYEAWASEFDLPSWRYAGCLPYFRKAETRLKGGDAWRGDSGPLKVSTGACRNPLYHAFIEAGVQAGYAATDDMNGHRQEGLGPMDMTVHEGRRCSTAVAYLRPAMQRRNLSLQIHTQVCRVLVDDARRAYGVEVLHKGRRELIVADREVILSGGAINSPQLLMLSGIGPGDALRQLGIAPQLHLPGVGQNLQDHLETYVQVACKQPITLYSALHPLAKARIGARWLLHHDGLGATNHFEAGGFIRSEAGVRHPDLQYHFLPMAVRYDGSAPIRQHGYQAHVGPMRSRSTGQVTLASADPSAPPRLVFNYLSLEQDRREFRAAIRLTREILAQAAFAPFRDAEISPGKEVQSDAAIDAHIRAQAETAYHPSCTCRMGQDAMAVVDGAGRVHGIESLRVVDASIMPRIVSGNLNAPTIMIAEKIADMIRGRQLPESTAPYWVHPHWESSQR